MTEFILGLGVALLGAILLASGSEMQSRAVYTARGRWSSFIKNPRWLFGLILLATAISTNFIALALAPISAIQSMSIVALAASTVFGALVGRVRVTQEVSLSVLASIVGILGFISVIATHPGNDASLDYDQQLPQVVIIQSIISTIGIVVTVFSQRSFKRPTRLVGLVVGAMGFGSITAVFKVLVRLVVRDGLAVTLVKPLSLVALVSIAVGGVIAIIQLQLAHKALPAPTVVAGLTITDTITAALIGTFILKESALTKGSGSLLLLFGAIAIGGVVGMRNLQRTSEVDDTAQDDDITAHTAHEVIRHMRDSDTDDTLRHEDGTPPLMHSDAPTRREDASSQRSKDDFGDSDVTRPTLAAR